MISEFGFSVDTLRAYLRGTLPELKGEMRLERIGGGQSNPTFFVTFAQGLRLVLRKQPPGELLKSAHAVDREFRILRALEPTPVPVPPTLFYCEEHEIIGTPFFFIEGLGGRG